MSLQVRQADFRADYAAIRRIRFEVFVDEQRVPESMELDDRDPLCLHVLAYDGNMAVGTGRLDLGCAPQRRTATADAGKIGRVAVLAAHRRCGVGTAVMRALHALAADHGLGAVWCNAQTSALPFYRHMGYRATGDVFMEAGIEHVRMEKTLAAPAR